MINKKAIWDYLLPFIIMVAVLILIAISYLVLSGKADSATEYLRTILNFGR